MKHKANFGKKIEDVVNEIDTYLFYKDNLLQELKSIDEEYQSNKISYEEYKKKQSALVQDASKGKIIDTYRNYMYYLLKRIEYYNAQIFLDVYNDKRYEKLKVIPGLKKSQSNNASATDEQAMMQPAALAGASRSPKGSKFVASKSKNQQTVQAEVLSTPQGSIQELQAMEKTVEEHESKLNPTQIPHSKRYQLGETIAPIATKKKQSWYSRLLQTILRTKSGTLTSTQEEVDDQNSFEPNFPHDQEAPQGQSAQIPRRKGKPHKGSRFHEVIHKKPEHVKGVAKIGNLLGLNLLRDLFQKKSLHQRRSNLVHHDLRLKYLRTGSFDDIGKTKHVDESLLVREAERIKKMMAQKKALQLYKPSVVGSVANTTVRNISFFLIDTFPDFFRNLYNNLRYSNIKILSNTYVNIMVLMTMVMTILAVFVGPILFFIQGNPLLTIASKSLFFCIFAGVTTFAGFFLYPILKIKERRRNIRTNLPFAINHMSAVASSGIPPNVIFKLISQTTEYGEISEEMRKIDQLISVFGYDFITSIKSISQTTPSKFFKEFLEGMASTIESGGDLQNFLEAKSKEAMVEYELERQKYTEAVATYSDVYTGILIAAPLFFVSALSLISILGGGIGGVPVDIIIAFGTYIAIPMLNVMFLIFLEVNQPEV